MPEVFLSPKPRLKMDREKAEEVRRLYSTGQYSYQKLADKFEVSKGTIADIIKRRTFK